MKKTFVALRDDRPGLVWQRRFAEVWPRPSERYRQDGLEARPTVAEARNALARCRTAKDAVATLIRIPVHMAQNVTVLDRRGDFATVFVGADREPAVCDQAVCTNHQEAGVWPEAAAGNRTLERCGSLNERLADPSMTLDRLVEGMLRPPLYAFDPGRGFATVDSALYRPAQGIGDYFWPGRRWRQSFDRFEPGSYTHEYAAAPATED